MFIFVKLFPFLYTFVPFEVIFVLFVFFVLLATLIILVYKLTLVFKLACDIVSFIHLI